MSEIIPDTEFSESDRSFIRQFEDLPDLSFAVGFVLRYGRYIKQRQQHAVYKNKVDGTRVTDVDHFVNESFISEVIGYSQGKDSVVGEEESFAVKDSMGVWIIDPIDGTRQYTEPNTKKMPENARNSTIGVAKLTQGILTTAAIANPFSGEIYYADKALAGSFKNGLLLNLGKTGLADVEFDSNLAYNYTYFSGGLVDTRSVGRFMQKKPEGHIGSTLYQACMVADGRIAFSVFPGRNLHDIAPAALVVELAGTRW